MRFLVLMTEADHVERWEAASDAEQQAVFDRFTAFTTAVSEHGAVVQSGALARPAEARTLRPGGEVTEGPYAETVEHLGGLYLVDLPDLDTAVDLVRLLPTSYTIEVRPVIAT